VILRYECEPAALAEMERVARLDEEILRHLTVVHPPESAIVGAGQGAEERTAAAPVSAGREEEDDE
jgi:ribosomal protein S6